MLDDAGSQILSSILTEPSQFVLVSDLLSADDFHGNHEAEIWRGMEKLAENNLNIGVDSLSGVVSRDCMDVVSVLSATYYCTSNIVGYAKSLSAVSRKRRLDARLDEAKKSDDPVAVLMRGIEEYTSLSETRETTFSELMTQTVDYLDTVSEGMAGIPSGIQAIDSRMSGWQGGRLVIVAARPSIGKTAITLQMAIHAANQGFRVGICSLEMSAHELGVRALAHTGKINISQLFRAEPYAMNQIGEAMGKTSKISKNLTFNVDQYRLADLINQIRLWVKRDGAQMAIVDHIGLVEVPGTKSANERLSQVTRDLKKLSKELNIPILAVSQLNRENAKAARMPVLSDLRDSGSIEQDADVCLFIHRDESTIDHPIYRFGLLKNRQGPAGWISKGKSLATFEFNGQHQEFYEVIL